MPQFHKSGVFSKTSDIIHTQSTASKVIFLCQKEALYLYYMSKRLISLLPYENPQNDSFRVVVIPCSLRWGYMPASMFIKLITNVIMHKVPPAISRIFIKFQDLYIVQKYIVKLTYKNLQSNLILHDLIGQHLLDYMTRITFL